MTKVREGGDMSGEESSYIAFISYRHAEVDTAVARDIQRGLERFHVPHALREEGAPAKLAPVFRDKEELPVSAAIGDDIAHALAHASALVVVCSPRTKESSWVSREIDTFLETHDRSRVFTVLAEGEPSDIIPGQLLSETVDGVEHALEPLSCDFRTARRGDRRTELVRLAAAILDVSFDSLIQRDRRRRTRIAVAAFCVVLAVVAGIAGFALWSNARIQQHYNEAVTNHARLLVTEAQQQLEGGDRLAAIELASAAVRQEGADRSMLPEAMHVLQQATGAYERTAGVSYVSSLRLVGRRALGQGIRHMCSSPNGAYVGILGNYGLVRVWDAKTLEQLFETRLPNIISNDIAITDSGRVILSCSERVSCWDLATKECCWDNDVEERTSGSYGEAKHLVLSSDQAHVYALGYSLACSLDVMSGECVSEISYGFAPGNNPSYVGGNTIDKDFVYDCVDNACVASMAFRGDEPGNGYDTLCVLDFAAGTCTILPTRYGSIRDVCLLDRTNVVISYGDGSSSDNRMRKRDGMVNLKPYQRHVTRKNLNTDEAAWQADVSLWSLAQYESLQPISNLDATFIEEGDARQVLAYCVADVCEVFDLDTGASLSHYETPQPFLTAWPHVFEGKVTGIYGCLAKGRTCANSFQNGGCVSPDNQCVDAEMGMRVGERAILATVEGELYAYESPKKDDAITTLMQIKASDAIPTKYGTLFVDEYVQGPEAGKKSARLCMVDCVGKSVKWERTIVGNEENAPDLMSYDEGCAELYVRLLNKSGEMDMTTVNMDTGEVQEWQGTSREDRVRENVAFVSVTATSSNRVVGETVRTGSKQGVAITDLHERKTQMMWFEDLGAEVGYDYAVPFSPDRRLMLVPTDAPDLDNPFLSRYVLMTDAGEKIRRLERPLNRNVPLAWSDDGGRFAGANDDTVVVYDVKGNELFTAPLEGRQVLGLHFLGDRLLVACNEQRTRVLMSYALDGTGSVLHTVLQAEEGNAGDALNTAVRWNPTNREKGSDKDPGDLCVVFPKDDDVFLIDSATLTVCQDLYGCFGYDAGSDCFMVRTYDVAGTGQDPHIGLFDRYTVDDLIARGAEQVGTSKLSDIQRAEFGL